MKRKIIVKLKDGRILDLGYSVKCGHYKVKIDGVHIGYLCITLTYSIPAKAWNVYDENGNTVFSGVDYYRPYSGVNILLANRNENTFDDFFHI